MAKGWKELSTNRVQEVDTSIKAVRRAEKMVKLAYDTGTLDGAKRYQEENKARLAHEAMLTEKKKSNRSK